MAKRLIFFIFGVAVYILSVSTILYTIGFVGNVFVPKSIDDGTPTSIVVALPINLVLITLFGIQHSVMARPNFKKWYLRIIPKPLERSMFVLSASLSLLLLFWQWRSLTGIVWNFPDGLVNIALKYLFWLGWVVVIISTFLINHFDLFGLRQVFYYLRGINYSPIPFKVPTLYKYTRHPMMFAILIAFWATPQMSVGHFLFAVGMTTYIFVGIRFEERDLLRFYGKKYELYRKQVSMLLPFLRME